MMFYSLSFKVCTIGQLGIYLLSKVVGDCSLPSELDGLWWDSEAGDIQFTQSTGKLSGWSVTFYTQTLSSFTCVTEQTSLLLFKSDNTVRLFEVEYSGFLCMQYTKLTSNSYRYYLLSDNEPQETSTRRIKVVRSDSVTAPYDISTLCNPTDGPPTEEYHVLVKQGRQYDVNTYLPDILLGVFSYTVNNGTTSYCGIGSVWDSCSNMTTIEVNYTQCSAKMFGPDSGHLTCVTSVTDGSNHFVTVINSNGEDTLFTCLAAVLSGNNVLVSTDPGSCAKGQRPTSRTTSSGSVTITLIPYETCPFSTDSSSTDGSTNVGVIVGIIIGSICLVIIIVFLAFVLHRRFVRRKLHTRTFHQSPRRSVAAPSTAYDAGKGHCHRPNKDRFNARKSLSPINDDGIEEVILHTPRVYPTKAIYISRVPRLKNFNF